MQIANLMLTGIKCWECINSKIPVHKLPFWCKTLNNLFDQQQIRDDLWFTLCPRFNSQHNILVCGPSNVFGSLVTIKAGLLWQCSFSTRAAEEEERDSEYVCIYCILVFECVQAWTYLVLIHLQEEVPLQLYDYMSFWQFITPCC